MLLGNKLLAALTFAILFAIDATRCSETRELPRNPEKTGTVIYDNKLLKFIETSADSETLNATLSKTVEVLQDALIYIEDLIESLAHDVLPHVPELASDGDELINKLTSRMANALSTFGQKLITASGNLIEDLFHTMLDQIIKLANEFRELAQKADEQLKWSVTYLNQTLMDHSENIDLWANGIKEKLRTVNDTRFYNESCQIIDDFMQRSTEQLQDCCNISIKPMEALCLSARKFLATAFRALADSLDRLHTCLDDKNSYLKHWIPCVDVVYDDVVTLTSRTMELRNKINTMLPIKILYTKCCLSVLIVEIEQHQHDIEANLLHPRSDDEMNE